MRLVYFDESGNTGSNLDDPQQPILVVGGLIVPEDRWQSLETSLEEALRVHLPTLNPSTAEIKASEIRNGGGPMKGIAVTARLNLRDAWLNIANTNGLKFVYRSIEKKRYKRWQNETFGAGVAINPQIAAFALVALVVNEYLAKQGSLGIFVIDETDEVGRDVEKSIRQLRLTSGPLKLSQIVEKGFFIESKKSRVLQLSDLCSLQARKMEEEKIGATKKPIDAQGIALIRPLIHRGNEQMMGILQWLKENQDG